MALAIGQRVGSFSAELAPLPVRLASSAWSKGRGARVEGRSMPTLNAVGLTCPMARSAEARSRPRGRSRWL